MPDKVLDKDLIVKQVIEGVPQQPPFRFIDNIIEISENHVVGDYRFRQDEFFYRGHFPGKPITPGVILIETMAQIGLVSLALYNHIVSGEKKNYLTLFTECEVEFKEPVFPGDRVIVRSEKLFFRRNKLKANVTLELENGQMAASGVISGFGVEQE